MWWSDNTNKRQVLPFWWTDQVVLNESTSDGKEEEEQGGVMDATELVRSIRVSILRLKGQFMNDTGSEVDYTRMGKSEAFAEYVELTKQLRFVDMKSLSVQERKAFMINIYNSLTIHGLAKGVMEDESSMLSRLKFYASVSYNISGFAFSLNDLEHGVLRNNKTSPTPFSAKPFASKDMLKLGLCVELDPRIHFALNCGAKGCPPIGVYSAKDLDKQLDLAAKAYLNETVVDVENNIIYISKLFKWYREDFGGTDGDVLSWIEHQSCEEVTNNIRLCKEKNANFPTLHYLCYDWNLPPSPKQDE